MLSLSDARAEIVRHLCEVSQEPATLADARGRLLREDIHAQEDLPAFDRSAMDGYALGPGDESTRFRVVGEVQAGAVPTFSVGLGECARIFTGAQLPDGAARVLPQEHATRDGEWMIPERVDGPAFVRKRGEDARAGDVLLPHGTTLRAGELALLAQIGAVQPVVSRALRVTHIVTGGELVPPDAVPASGQIRDSNSTLIRALLQEVGISDLRQSRAPDDPAALEAQVQQALSSGCDLLLMSGGASVGDYDFGARVLKQAGFEIIFNKVNLRPGKPLVFATKGEVAAFILPGNPLSHFVVFQLAVRLAIARLTGAPEGLDMIRLPVHSVPPAQEDPRDTFWPVKIRAVAGQLVAQTLQWQSSGDLRGMVGVHGLLRIRPGSSAVDNQGLGECLLVNAPFQA